uniref:Uncharacterized protein n=1 Tax=Clastoptera arizonana TaxID=38151 RepID=A0A1B6CC18_9HEMI
MSVADLRHEIKDCGHSNEHALKEVHYKVKNTNDKSDYIKCCICFNHKFDCNLENVLNKKALGDLLNLTELKLVNSEITDFPEVITQFINLVSLDLSYNKLKTLPNNCILLKKLRYLDVSHNQIRSETPKCFELGLHFIKHLNLSYNLICTFNFVPQCQRFLCYLNLSHNYFQEVPLWLFSDKCYSLKHVDLSFSCVLNRNLQKVLQKSQSYQTGILKYLETLSISNCSTTTLSLSLLKYFEEIKCLNVGNIDSNITEMGPWKKNIFPDIMFSNIFYDPEKVTELYLNNTGLALLSTDIDLLKNLKVLDISKNELTWLPETFVLLQHLEKINVSNNNLAYLPKNFNKMLSIQELYLSNNKLENVESEIKTLMSLKILDLYDNCLETMPITGNQIRTLSKCDISYNYFSIETELNYVFEDGMNALDLYRALEKDLRLNINIKYERLSVEKPKLEHENSHSPDCLSDTSDDDLSIGEHHIENNQNEDR